MPCKRSSRQPELTKEVRKLADLVGGAIKSAARSQEAADIRSEVTRSVRALGERVNKAVQKVSESPKLGQIKGQTKKVVSLSREEGLKATKNLRQNLSAGLDAAGRELQRLAEKLKKS